jgi:hypothetical protein
LPRKLRLAAAPRRFRTRATNPFPFHGAIE